MKPQALFLGVGILVVCAGLLGRASSRPPQVEVPSQPEQATEVNGPDKILEVVRFPWASVDFDSDTSQLSAAQRAKCLRYNLDAEESSWVEHPTGPKDGTADLIGLPDPFFDRVLPLPIADARLVIQGTVVASEAHLSYDRRNVFTQFSLRVDAVLKSDPNLDVRAGASLLVDRQGADVLYSPTYTIRHYVQRKGMPELGKQYVLFLRALHDNQDLDIITGYEIQGATVMPLDGRVNNGGYPTQFDTYAHKALTTLLHDIASVPSQQPQVEDTARP